MSAARVLSPPPPYAKSDEANFKFSRPDDASTAGDTPTYTAPADAISPQPTHATVKVPASLSGSLNWWKCVRTIYLGPSDADKEHFAAKWHSGYRKLAVEVFDGPAPESGLLGKLESEKGGYMNIVIPREAKEVVVRYKVATREFALEKEGGGRELPEVFHWRRTSGVDAQVLAGGKSTPTVGWKLVRGPAPEKEGAIKAVKSHLAKSKGKEDTPGVTSDGREVVAVLCYSTAFANSNAFKFAFLGEGLTGKLGYDFEVATLVSAMNFWRNGSEDATADGATMAMAGGSG